MIFFDFLPQTSLAVTNGGRNGMTKGKFSQLLHTRSRNDTKSKMLSADLIFCHSEGIGHLWEIWSCLWWTPWSPSSPSSSSSSSSSSSLRSSACSSSAAGNSQQSPFITIVKMPTFTAPPYIWSCTGLQRRWSLEITGGKETERFNGIWR